MAKLKEKEASLLPFSDRPLRFHTFQDRYIYQGVFYNNNFKY
ncbi:hypothetical protein ACI8B_20128 [Acinetobacter proteolyticus]|uniref:Uncharacterized protein n=1 Tax=Acinetobacter proteolyticus TaxID=1776741 RepID=A0A653K2P6_9GAMM|nr:hypothetical protein ACI8B_20128 [Acinetobacter proteolyticus]